MSFWLSQGELWERLRILSGERVQDSEGLKRVMSASAPSERVPLLSLRREAGAWVSLEMRKGRSHLLEWTSISKEMGRRVWRPMMPKGALSNSTSFS